jgi:hypothetical protein
VESIIAAYARDEGRFRVVVTGHGQSRDGVAPDIVAARVVADALVAQVVPAGGSAPVVVHLLDGSGVAFTHTYLTAQLGLAPPASSPSPSPSDASQAEA